MGQKDRAVFGLAIGFLGISLGVFSCPARADDDIPLIANNPVLAPNVSPQPSISQEDPFKDLKNVERRFFFHSYDHDPIDKRLERIELLVFGGIQSGENTERLKRIRTAILKRDREAAQDLSHKNQSIKAASPKATTSASSVQYPILQTLEWRVLKKTFGAESLDQRLDRLETALLGQPSPAMSYSDRVERLSKIAGIDGANNLVSPPVAGLGPRPRASKRMPNANSPFASPYITPLPRGFGGDDTSTFEEDFEDRANIDMRTMMEHMQRMMQDMPEMRRLPGGTVPFGRGLMVPIPDGNASPYAVPAQKKPKIPPYADPNSI